jgi:hypothetical protein
MASLPNPYLRNDIPHGKRRSKSMLLPLPGPQARAMSLENHLSLVALHSDYCTIEHVSCLLRVLYLAFFIQEALQDRRYLDRFLKADEVIDRCVAKGENQQRMTTSVIDNSTLEKIITLHDEQLATISSYVFTSAQERLINFACSGADSPIKPLYISHR